MPNVLEDGLVPFDYIVVTTKNIPDIPPSVSDIIRPAVTPGHTAIVLSQNGLHIEKPLIEAFPTNHIISSICMLGASETAYCDIVQHHRDLQIMGPFHNPGVDMEKTNALTCQYIDMYKASGRATVVHEPDIAKARWRKLVYNSSFNSVAALLGIDTARMRMSKHIVDDLIRPIMLEIVAAAAAAGVELPSDLVETTIRLDPVGRHFKPSMCQDYEKGRFMEFENIVGEPLRDGEKNGVSMPTLRVVYGLLKGQQLKIKEVKGLWTAEYGEDNPYRGDA